MSRARASLPIAHLALAELAPDVEQHDKGNEEQAEHEYSRRAAARMRKEHRNTGKKERQTPDGGKHREISDPAVVALAARAERRAGDAANQTRALVKTDPLRAIDQ